MSREILRIVSARGGCLDALVGVATLGNFGVETTAMYPVPLRPTGSDPTRWPEGSITVTDLALQTGEIVSIEDFNAANEPQVSRRIVRNARV